MEEEIDLRQYVTVLLKYKLSLITVPVVVAIITFVFMSTQQPVYEAESSLAMLRLRSEIAFEPKFKTIEDQDSDPIARRNTLVALAGSSAVAAAVLPQIDSELIGTIKTVGQLGKLVETTQEGNLIIITVQTSMPELAAEIANLWAKEAEIYINEIYSRPSERLADIKNKLATSRQDYSEKQTALETFIATNKIRALNRQFGDLTKIREGLYERHLNVLSLGLTAQYDLIIKPGENYYNTLLNQRQTVLDKEVGQSVDSFNYYYSRQKYLAEVLVELKALKERLAGGNQSTSGEVGDALAMLQAKAGLFNVNGMATINLQLNTLENLAGNPAEYAAELDSLIAQVETESTKTTKKFEELSQLLSKGENYNFSKDMLEETDPLYQAATNHIQSMSELKDLEQFLPGYEQRPLYEKIATLDTQIDQLQAGLETEQARQKELTGERDLAWEAYETIQRKLAEVQVSEQSPASEVRFAVQALPPQYPLAIRIWLNVVIATLIGTVITTLVIFVFNWWYNDLSE